MKALSLFTLLTIGCLSFYSGNSFADDWWKTNPGQQVGAGVGKGQTVQGIQQNQNGANVSYVGSGGNPYQQESSKDATTNRVAGCISSYNDAVGNAANFVIPTDQLPNGYPAKSGNYTTNLTNAQKDPTTKSAAADYLACVNNRPPSNPDAENNKCDKAEASITKLSDKLTEECKGAAKVNTDSYDKFTPSSDSDTDNVIDTSKTASKNKSGWGVCVQDANSCRSTQYGGNDSASKCTETTLEDLSRAGADNDKLLSFCHDQYPPECGSFDASDLKSTAREMTKDLESEQLDLTKEIAEKKKEIKDNQDKLYKDDTFLKKLPDLFAKQNSDLQKSYEALVKKNNDQLDATLEKNYTKITSDEADIKTAAAAVTQADAVKFDAQNKFVNACKVKAKADADKQFPSGQVNYGGTNALITRNARWSDYYTNELNQLYADGTTCDGGNYANAQLALLNAEKAQTQAQAQLQTDQNNLRVAMMQVASKKSDAQYKAMTDQAEKVQQAAKDQQQASQDANKAIYDDRTAGAKAQDELNKLQAKLDAAPRKRQCINTLNSCANVPGMKSGRSSDTGSIVDAPNTLKQLLGACKSAAKICNKDSDAAQDPKSQIEASKRSLDSILGTNPDPWAKLDVGLLPIDYSGPENQICKEAVAAKYDELTTAAASKKAFRRNGTTDSSTAPKPKSSTKPGGEF